MWSKRNPSMNNMVIGKEFFSRENFHSVLYFHLGKIVFSLLLIPPIYPHLSLLWFWLSMAVFGRIISLIRSSSLFPFSALDQDKPKDSTSPYKLFSDTSNNEQGNWMQTKKNSGVFLFSIFSSSVTCYWNDACNCFTAWCITIVDDYVLLFRFSSNGIYHLHSKWVMMMTKREKAYWRISFLVLATMGFAYLLTPCCQVILRSCSDNTK